MARTPNSADSDQASVVRGVQRALANAETLPDPTLSVPPERPADDFLSDFVSEKQLTPPAQRSRRDLAHSPTVGAPIPRRFSWKRIGIAVLAVLALFQGGLIAWWLLSGRATPARTSPVRITSEPTGVPVTVDGVARGVTPFSDALDAGTHTIQVGAGGDARTQTISVERGAASSVHIALPVVGGAERLPAQSGRLQISTEPDGATVSIDGEPRGVSPILIEDLTAGPHEVTVSRAGNVRQRSVTVEAGAMASLLITMSNSGVASGWLTIDSPIPAQIFEAGTLLGRTDTPRILLPIGAHQLELVNEALGFRVQRAVQISAGQNASLRLEPVNGTLSVNAQPWAEVWIDGQPAGETPIGNLSIPIGTHELVFRHPQFAERRQTVTVAVSTPARVGVDLRK